MPCPSTCCALALGPLVAAKPVACIGLGSAGANAPSSCSAYGGQTTRRNVVALSAFVGSGFADVFARTVAQFFVGRYLADEVDDAERQQIEGALVELPELRKLTDLVLDVLRDFEPLTDSTVAAVRLWRFAPARQDGANAESAAVVVVTFRRPAIR